MKGPSLLERAAETYDFRRELRRAPETPAAPKAFAPVAPIAPRFAPAAAIDRAMLGASGLLLPDSAPGMLGEEFRIAKRALLLEAERNSRARLILVTSAQAHEGKTFCALNLALSIAAEPDRTVLLVDGDVAKPDILARLGVDPAPGLMDVLTDLSLDAERQIIATDIARLSLLPAGRRTNGDTEALASARTKSVLDGLLAADPNRIVIVDSPPVLATSAASTLALHAGQIAMIVRADRTSESELKDALALLSGCGTIQLLLNAVSLAPGGRRFGAYYPEDQ